jgi:hypothetical protein
MSVVLFISAGRGQLSEMGRTFGGVGSSGSSSSHSSVGVLGSASVWGAHSASLSRFSSTRRSTRRTTEIDFISKVRKRRETSSDITVIKRPIVLPEEGVGVQPDPASAGDIHGLSR